MNFVKISGRCKRNYFGKLKSLLQQIMDQVEVDDIDFQCGCFQKELVVRDDDEMRKIKSVSYYLYFQPTKYPIEDVSRAEELVNEVIRAGPEKDPFFIVTAATLSIFSRRGFTIINFSRSLGAMVLTTLEFPGPQIPYNWLDAVEVEEYGVVRAFYQLRLYMRSYMLQLELSPSDDDDVLSINIYFWSVESSEGAGMNAFIEVAVVEEFIKAEKWLWLALYLEKTICTVFQNKLHRAVQDLPPLSRADISTRFGDISYPAGEVKIDQIQWDTSCTSISSVY